MLTIFTDTDTDITPKEAQKYGYKLISMPYIIDGKEIRPYVDFDEFNYHEFYDMLRKRGEIPTTCAINPFEYRSYFEEEFKKGNDILYVHFSKSMTGTFNAMNIAVEELLEEYPGRKFYAIDTMGITILSLNIVKEIGDLYLEGKTAEEIMDWADKNIKHFATYFYADTLDFFAKSGRVSNVTKFFGNLIGIKPIIYMDDAGKMTSLSKERGKSKALNRLCEYFNELTLETYEHRVIIGHSDALDLAKKLGGMLIEKYGENLKIEYAVVNPTAGSHCGPDCIGVCFYAKHK